MHFLCACGNQIQDSSDYLRYKANFIADQDSNGIWGWIDELEKFEEDVDREQLFEKFSGFLKDVTMRSMYQCPECGRLYLSGNILGGDKQLYAFTPEFKPEKETNTCLLQSCLEGAWKSRIRAEWEENSSGCLATGNIYLDINGDRFEQYEFEDYGEFEERYYHLFHELKDICLEYAGLCVEQEIVHEWSLEEKEKEKE